MAGTVDKRVVVIELPSLPLAATVFLFVDVDPTGEAAAQSVAQRLARHGRNIRLARPIIGRDFNDAVHGDHRA